MKQFLQSLNREKVIQEILGFEADLSNHKCRILQVVMPYLSKCSANVLKSAIQSLTQLMAHRPFFELKPTVLENYAEQCEIMQMVVLICDRIGRLYPLSQVEDDSSPIVKFLMRVVGLLFVEDKYLLQRKNALSSFYKNQLQRISLQECLSQSLPLPKEFQALWMDPMLDQQNNFNQVMNELIRRAEKSGLELSCNSFTVLEFLNVRRRILKGLLRLQSWFYVFLRQAEGLG